MQRQNLYKHKTYQYCALTHHLRDALSQLCGHARLIQATREFAFHSRISFAFVHSCCCSFCRFCCCFSCFHYHAGVKRCMENKLLLLFLLALSLCKNRQHTHTHTYEGRMRRLRCQQRCSAMTNSFILPRFADAARTKAPSKDTAKFFLLYTKLDRTHTHTHTCTTHARSTKRVCVGAFNRKIPFILRPKRTSNCVYKQQMF